MDQTLKEILDEQGIKLEPQMPPGKTVSTLIQRGWSLLFGRKGTYLYPAHVERLGGLMVMPFEGLVAPDNTRHYELNSSFTTYQWDLTTARPRITEVKAAQSLIASPFTLSGDEILEVHDGPMAPGNEIVFLPGGCHAAWVYTVSQYLSLFFNPAGAVECHVTLRSWDL